MTRSLMACSTTLVLAMAGLAPTALAQHQAAPSATRTTSDFVAEEGVPQFGGVLYPTTHKPGAHVQPSLRGTTVVYNSITGASGYSRLTQGPAAILDDGFFTPGPASLTGATISEIDFMVRPIVAIPTIFVRLTVWDTIFPANPIVQDTQIFSETYQITGTAANTTPALYIFTADVTDFIIPDDDWAIEIAFLDATGNILPNARCTTDFPNAASAATQPTVGDNAEIWWVDNDLGTIIGDGIRYEPYDAAQAMVNQGDAIAWGGAAPPSNAVCFTFRGLPNDPNIGACCLADFTCQATDQAGCDTAGGVFSGPGTSCSVNFCVPPPANDDCINAITITGSLPMTVSYDNAGATQDGPDDCITPFAATGPDNDVWFKWTADCTGVVRISTCLTTGTDDKLAVYEGSNCGDLSNQVACDDDGCSADENAPTAPFESSADFSVTQGTTYLIRMGNFPGEPGQDGSAFNLESVSCVGGPAFCDADWCQDGAVGVPDIFCFLSDWFAFVPAARNYGGTPGVPAIFAFLSIWFSTGQGPCTP